VAFCGEICVDDSIKKPGQGQQSGANCASRPQDC
jgi:hypothetical protein